MNHVQLALRNLRRRPARSILTALGVALAVGSFITLYGLSRSVHQNVQQSFDEHGADLTARRRGIAEPFGGTVPEGMIAQIAAIAGVTAVSGELVSLAATERDDHVIAAGWAADSFFWQHVPLQEGRVPRAGERKVALLGGGIPYAKNRDFAARNREAAATSSELYLQRCPLLTHSRLRRGRAVRSGP